MRTPFNFVTTITSEQGGGGFPGYPSLTMQGLSSAESLSGLGGLAAEDLGGLAAEDLGGFGAVSEYRKRYIRRLARRVAGKGSTMVSFYSSPSNRLRALQNIYFRRQLLHYSGNPLFRRPLDPEEWADVFVPAYRKLRPDDKIPGVKSRADYNRLRAKVKPLKEEGSDTKGDDWFNEGEDGATATITTSGGSPGRIPAESIPVTSISGLAGRLTTLARGLESRISRATGREDVVLRIRRVRLLWAAALAEAAGNGSDRTREAVLERIRATLALPIYYINGVVRLDCGASPEAGLSGLGDMDLGYVPGAAYGPGAGVNIMPQVAAGYLPAQPPEILRHTFDVVSRTVIPGDRPGAVRVPRFATNNLPDAIAQMQPRPPFTYPQGPMTGVTALALPNGQLIAPPPGQGMIPAAVNQQLGKPKLPATLPVVGGPTTRTQIAGFAGLGASVEGGTGRTAANTVLLGLVWFAAQDRVVRAFVSRAVNAWAKARSSDRTKQAAYRRLLMKAVQTKPDVCSAEGVRVIPVGARYDESVGG